MVDRDAAGLLQLCTRLEAIGPEIIVLEATGGFETIVAAALTSAELAVAVVNPVQVRAFAKALGERAKTDPIDARVIAHFAAATGVRPRPLPSESTCLLADLVQRRRQIMNMIGAERNRDSRATLRMRKSIARLINALEKELESVETDIDEHRARLTSLGCEGGPALLRARHRLRHLTHADRGAARAWNARPQAHRRARRTCTIHASIGQVEG